MYSSAVTKLAVPWHKLDDLQTSRRSVPMSNPPQRDTILQAGAIPFRRGECRTEFCLITSSSGGRWGFPKGIIESGDTAQGTALQEAFEEAGLHGRIIGDALGSYRYEKWGSELVVTM